MSDTPKTSLYLGKPVPELVKLLCDGGDPQSRLILEVKGALAAKLTQELCQSIDRHERAATRLSVQLLWLNIILGAFTVLGTVLTIWSLVR